MRNRKLEPFLEHRKTQHGKRVWYFRRDRDAGTPRIRLPDLYGTVEFREAYQAALAGLPIGQPRQASRGKLKWLVDLYLASQAWKSLKPATRKARGIVLQRMVEAGADADVEDAFTRENIVEEMGRTTVHMGNLLLNTLRVMGDWAVEAGHLVDNPATKVRYVKAPASDDPDAEEGHKTWSDDDCAQFERVFPLGTRERLAYSVLLFTGLRVGDAARLGRQHVQKDGTLMIRNEKTGAVVYIPILPDLRQALDAGPHGLAGELAFITGPRGRAWGKAHLGDWFAEAAKRAGLTDCTAHGLRKAGATRCANAGYSEEQLKALFGWTRSETAAKYTRKANKKRLALAAAQGLVRAAGSEPRRLEIVS